MYVDVWSSQDVSTRTSLVRLTSVVITASGRSAVLILLDFCQSHLLAGGIVMKYDVRLSMGLPQ